jgi:UDP-N-acetylmuramoyl-L-alanyl-D-glutamate--2,6-diaminopimelate ligase
MNRIDLGQNFEVIVDFAHTPDAFEKVFNSVYPHGKGRIISLFGGAGRRDESTRAERGEVAGRFSDICILTEDDSRDEDPNTIMSMFESGLKKSGMKDSQIIKIVDRKSAIEKAISIAKPGDLVLILGKGHEKTILRADGPHSFEDLKVTTSALKSTLK